MRRLVLVVLALALAGAGCGDDDDGESVGGGTSTTTTSATPPGAEWTGQVEVDAETGEVTAPGLNELIDAEQPDWAASARGAAEMLLHLGDGAGSPEGSTIELTEAVDEQG
ncbi:MAG: hypothetical protein ACREJR_07480, partial [Candidatus Rokuibacteriota bacterium]